MDATKSTRRYLADIGRKGGSSRTEKKVEAGRVNIEKARLALEKKRNEKKPLDNRLVVGYNLNVDQDRPAQAGRQITNNKGASYEPQDHRRQLPRD